MDPLQGDAPGALSSYATLQCAYHPDSSACALQAGTRNFAEQAAGPQPTDAVVDCILCHVALPTRLFTCATVCKAHSSSAEMEAAAAASVAPNSATRRVACCVASWSDTAVLDNHSWVHLGAESQPGVQPAAAAAIAVASWPACLNSLQGMQQLQELRLRQCRVDPCGLGSSTGLKKLHLTTCELVPGKRAGTRALLTPLAGLTQLQAVHVSMELLVS